MKNLTPNNSNETASLTSVSLAGPSCPANATQEGFISREELARRLQKSIRTIANWQRQGIIPFVKIENSTWFNWSEVQSYLQKNFRVCPAPAERLLRIPVIAMVSPKRKEKHDHS